jgi:hypothetical protein
VNEQRWSASTDAGGLATRPVGTRFRAVQQDVAVTVVDWPVVHAWSEGDPDFVGSVTVLDEAGAQLATTDWPAPTDLAADRSLGRIGWQRVGPWQRDWLGRRAAPVTRAHPPTRQRTR